MYVSILQERIFIVAICTTPSKSWKVLGFRHKPWKNPGTLMQKVLEKVKKGPGKSWKDLEFESIFLVGTM